MWDEKFTPKRPRLAEIINAKFDWILEVRLNGRHDNRSVRAEVFGECFDATEVEAKQYASGHWRRLLPEEGLAVKYRDFRHPEEAIIGACHSMEWEIDSVYLQPRDPVVDRVFLFRQYVQDHLQLQEVAKDSAASHERKNLWYHVHGCIEVMDDAAKGIVAFLLDGVEGTGRYGESFLRLSGVLACACNQQQSIITLYKQLEVTPRPDLRPDLNLKAWREVYNLRNWIACHSLGFDFITTHVPLWTEGHYVGFSQVKRKTLDKDCDEMVNLANLLRDWQQDVIVILDDLQPRLERAVRSNQGTTPPTE